MIPVLEAWDSFTVEAAAAAAGGAVVVMVGGALEVGVGF